VAVSAERQSAWKIKKGGLDQYNYKRNNLASLGLKGLKMMTD